MDMDNLTVSNLNQCLSSICTSYQCGIESSHQNALLRPKIKDRGGVGTLACENLNIKRSFPPSSISVQRAACVTGIECDASQLRPRAFVKYPGRVPRP